MMRETIQTEGQPEEIRSGLAIVSAQLSALASSGCDGDTLRAAILGTGALVDNLMDLADTA